MTDTGFVTGYGGWCRMGRTAGSVTVPMKSASYSRSVEAARQGGFALWKSDSKFQIGPETYTFSGSVDFDYTAALLNYIMSGSFLSGDRFYLELHDGEAYLIVDRAVWSSVTLSASENSLVSGNVAFSSCNGYSSDILVYSENRTPSDDAIQLQPYWRFGKYGVSSFELQISRNVTPVFLNEKHWNGPTYMRIGLMEASARITCWQSWMTYRTLVLGDKAITFNSKSFVSSKDYSFGDATGDSVKTYTLSASAKSSTDGIFTITSIN